MYIILQLLFLGSLNLFAQQLPVQYHMALDTIHLQEVKVSSTIPLNDKQVEKFYKTDYFSTIDNLTSHLDGISLIKRGSYAMEPQLSGFSGGQLNVTISGMKMFGACTDKMDPVTSYIEPTNLKSITLEHGTNGGLYGNNIGGSIDMALQEPDNKSAHPFYISPSIGYESVSNSKNILISTGYTKNKLEWGLNGVYRKNDNYRDGSGNEIQFSQFEKYNIHSVLKFLPDSVSCFKTDILYDIAKNVGYAALPMDVSKARAVLLAVEYKRTKCRNEILAKVYYNSVYHVMDDSRRDSLFYLKNQVNGNTDTVIMRMDMPGGSKTFGSYIQSTTNLGRKNKLLIKADNYINRSLAEMTMHMHFIGKPPDPPMYLQTWPDILRNVTGLFVQYTTRLSDKLFLTVNSRIDFNLDKLQSSLAAEQFSVFNYKLSRKYQRSSGSLNILAQYEIVRPLLITFQTGISERIPTISELFGFYLYNAYDGYDYIGNPNLKTEKSLSGKLDFTYFKNGLKVNLSQTASFLIDYIMGVTNTEIPPLNFYTNGLRVYNNVPGAKLFSTDLQIMYNPVDKLNIFLLSKYTLGRLDSKKYLPLIPPLKNVLSVSYEIKRFTIQAENETALKQNNINVSYGENRSPAYTLFNLKTTYHLVLKDCIVDCSAGITNLFNAEYYEHLDWGRIARPGRSLNLFLKLTY
jgi:iron complex outermembrane receptor protein